MGKTRLSLRRTGSAIVLVAVLFTGCGDDENAADVANGDEAGGETPESDEQTSDGTAAPEETEASDDAGESDDADDAEDAGDASGEDGDTDAETFEITIADGEVSPPFDTYEVAHGADVRIEITSDTADELHLHGYDLELALEPGETGVLEFTADIEGRFELETHELGLRLLQLEVG